MKNLFRMMLLGAFMIALNACATESIPTKLYSYSPDFNGMYISTGIPGLSLIMSCASNTSCEIDEVEDSDGKPESGQMVYHNAAPLKDTGQLQFAFDYAYEHRNQSSASAEDKALLKSLEPLFKQKSVEFNNCIDLDPDTPKYMVACKLTSSPWEKPTILFFATLLENTSNCSGSFCRFMITSMLGMEFKPKQ
jgi:hypothetical protein